MNAGQTADQLVNQSLKATEHMTKLAALGAKHLALILLALYNENKDIFSRTGIDKIVEKGEMPSVLPLNKSELQAFREQAKKFDVKFLAISDKDSEIVDVILNSQSAPFVNRILEKIGYAQPFISEEISDPNGKSLVPQESELSEQGSFSKANNKTRTTSSDEKQSVAEKVENIKFSLKIEDKKAKGEPER